MSFVRAVAITAQRLYDLVATYLLFHLLPFALLALGVHLGAMGLAALVGMPDPAMLYVRAGRWVGIDAVALRIVLLLPLHVLLWVATRRPRRWIRRFLERDFDRTAERMQRRFGRWPRLQAAGGLLYTTLITALLIPFVLQPTLVPARFGARSWAARGANLLDGTASVEVVASVVGFYRRFTADPVVVAGVSRAEFAAGHAPLADRGGDPRAAAVGKPGPPPVAPVARPLMDRWDPMIRDVAGGDPERFAVIKAFLYVESRGEQYAVSPTGCAGLMQFCSGTARARPFRAVFGVGQIYACDCSDGCRVGREVRVDLESGQRDRIEAHADDFPCELTDSRFDPAKSIEAGAHYVARLDAAYGGNVALMYIGYNSGPLVADGVWAALGGDAGATLADIEPHLADAMVPFYGDDGWARADGLLRGTLPDLLEAHAAYSSTP